MIGYTKSPRNSPIGVWWVAWGMTQGWIRGWSAVGTRRGTRPRAVQLCTRTHWWTGATTSGSTGKTTRMPRLRPWASGPRQSPTFEQRGCQIRGNSVSPGDPAKKVEHAMLCHRSEHRVLTVLSYSPICFYWVRVYLQYWVK